MQTSFILKDIARRVTLDSLAARYEAFDRSGQECFLALLSVAGAMMEAIEAQLAHYRISQGRIRILLELEQAPGQALAAGALAQRLGLTPATITGLLDGLERASLARRERRHEDRRGVKVCLTSRGAKLLARIMPERFRRNARLMSKLSEPERRVLLRLLATVSRGMEAFSRP